MRNIDKKYHYLYKTTNLLNNKYYYGIHSTNNLEDGYLGSGKHIKYSIRKYGQENFKKEIIEYFNTRAELSLAENLLITKNILQDKYCMNCMYGGEYFNTMGMLTVKDKDGNYFKVFNDDSRYLSGEFIFYSTGKAVVKDENGNNYQVDKNDPRILTGELVSTSTGKLNVKDKNNKVFRVNINDPKYLTGEFISANKGLILAKDKYNNYCMIDKNNEKYLNGELVSIWKDRKHKQETKNKIGLANSIKQKGEGNSQFGTCWITRYSEITKNNENKKIKKEELDNYLLSGWIKGRKLK